ncbi:hypothetical protein CWE09_09760 [Aliidiomarina minuta]|uniref:Uncharacterized protein n=1 Tax=Aliidiomarina minuta TaxID=880057 RepID=A0A432WAE9_9GAMM|nr:hypothetical protein [Aliidiomarina minuta]RUO26956.1 hypothetical protein CWE09_09760 [Aliidiomarina minuta]
MEYIIIIALVAAGFLFFRSSVLGKQKPESKPAPEETKPTAEASETVSAPVAEKSAPATAKKKAPVKTSPVKTGRESAPAAKVKTESKEPAVAKEKVAAPTVTPQTGALPEPVVAQIDALQGTQDPLSRHRLYVQITDATYKDRKTADVREAFKHYAEQHVNEFKKIKPLLKKQNGGKLPQVLTFQNYANVLMEDGQYDKAIAVCEEALAHGLDDKTRTGFKGRIERIQAKAS